MDRTEDRLCAYRSRVHRITVSITRRCVARQHPIEANRGCTRRQHGSGRRTHYRTLAEFPPGVGGSKSPGDHRRLSGAGDCSYQPWLSRSRRAGRTTWAQSALRFNGRTGGGRSHGHNQATYVSYHAIFIAAAALVCRSFLLSAAFDPRIFTSAEPVVSQIIEGRAHRREPGI